MAATKKRAAAKPRVDDFDELDDEMDFGLTDDEEAEDSEDGEDEGTYDGYEDEIPEEHDHVLTLDEIVNAPDTEEEELYIREWGGKVVIRSVTKTEFDNLRRIASLKQNRGRRNEILERELILAGVVSPRLTMESYQMLRERSAGPCLRILNAIYRKSGLEDLAEEQRERRFPKK